MASLEELMPELAGVLAAQESALETVVATLSTHVRALLADSERQARRVQQLEGKQRDMETAMAAVQGEARASRAEAAALEQRVEQTLGSVQAATIENAVAAAEKQTMGRLEKYVDTRLEKVSGAAQPGVLQEAVQNQLELLDKKFDYLSRVKMEIKDLTRKVDKQDQTIDGMKIGLEMLSKSIGVDEGNSDSGDDDDDDGSNANDSDSDMSDVQLPVNDIFGARSSSSLTDLSLSFDRLHQSPDEDVERAPSPRLLDENVRNMAAPHAQIKRLAQRRSLTLDVRHALEIKEAKRNALTSRGTTAVRRASSPQPKQRIEEAPTLHEESPQLSSRSDAQNELAPVSDRAEESRAGSDSQRSTGDEPSTPEIAPTDTMTTADADESGNADPAAEVPTVQPVEAPAVNQFDTHNTEVPEDEQVKEDKQTKEDKQVKANERIKDDSPAPKSPDLERQQVFPIAEEPETPALTSTPRTSRDENDSKPPASATSSIVQEESKQRADADDDIPVVYKQRTLSHQKQLEDSVALFHPASSSSSASSTSRTGHPISGRPALIPSASAVFRSRRQERNIRRQTMLIRKESEVHSDRRETTARAPLSLRSKKETWRRIFAKLIQLRRLHMLNGSNPEKSLFRKQNTSVGARVRRLEETSVDLEKAIEMLEANIHMNAHGVQTLDELLSQYRLTTSSSVQTLALEQKSHSQALLEMDEKMELLDQEVRRMRSSNRRNSVQNSASSTTAIAAISVQVQHVMTRLDEQTKVLEAADTLIKQLAETDLPAVQERADESLRSFRVEVERRLKDWVAESRKSLEALNAAIADTNRSLSTKFDGSFDRIYSDVLTVTTGILRGAELAQDVTSAPSSSQAGQQPRRSFDTGIEMLETILSKFAGACNSFARAGESEDAIVIAEQAITFLRELQQLQSQATKAMPLLLAPTPATPDGANNNSSHINAPSATNSSTKGFEEHLIQVTTKYLKTLESLLVQRQDESSPNGDSGDARAQRDSEVDPASDELMSFVRDAVIQVRAVLFLLRFCRQTSDEHQELQEMQSSQATMAQDLGSHSFAISQVGSTLAMVKLMSTRLDSFLELSFSFAKDDDVKKSIQEMMSTSVTMRDKLAKQVEDAQREAAQRDAMLERDLNQLISRVNKKLDKDELLWTQEVLERQLQSVAKASLGEEDLVDIHRLLQHKLDKTQFNALLQDQRAKMMAAGNTEVIDWLSGGPGGNTSGNGPLVGAKCISCQGELPPSKAMIKTVVKQEVQHEIAKVKAQQHVGTLVSPSAQAGFSASNHRNMEKFKTEMLLSSLQKQAKK